MDIEKAKKIIEKGIKPEYERLRQYDGYKYTGGWLEAIEVLLNELDKKDEIIIAMAEQLTTPVHGVDWVIDYFTKKVTKEEIK